MASAPLEVASGQPVRVPMLIGGEWSFASSEHDSIDPYRGGVVAHAPNATADDLDAALAAAVAAKARAAAVPAYQRAALIHRVAALLDERVETEGHVLALDADRLLRRELAHRFATCGHEPSPSLA